MTEDNKNLIPLGSGALPAIIERRTQLLTGYWDN